MPRLPDKIIQDDNDHKADSHSIHKAFRTGLGFGWEVEERFEIDVVLAVTDEFLPIQEAICDDLRKCHAGILKRQREFNTKLRKRIDVELKLAQQKQP